MLAVDVHLHRCATVRFAHHHGRPRQRRFNALHDRVIGDASLFAGTQMEIAERILDDEASTIGRHRPLVVLALDADLIEERNGIGGVAQRRCAGATTQHEAQGERQHEPDVQP
ncbi:MAG: hypothetical protein KA505_04500 [Xanthomonadales bacterium]|nr:hypothetical protein [Xanthomonadales bacterium]